MLNNVIHAMSARTAAPIVGVAFLLSVVIVTLVDDVVLANFVVPGDDIALAQDIVTNPKALLLGAIGYLAVLLLDCIIGLALYVVLKPANRRLAVLTAALRLIYAGLLMAGVVALLFGAIDVPGFAAIKLLGYVFFAAHIFMLGCVILMSGYFPKILGIALIIASLSYGVFIVDVPLPEAVLVLAMLTMAGAEILLSLWLLVKRKSLPG